jgi:phosphatidylglycerol:prolipoprotein diacylglycerol transferase
MYPTLFTIGNRSISTYTVLLDLGLILGLVLAYREGQRLYRAGGPVLDLGLWSIVGGVVAGRIGYVLANWGAFAEDWVRALYLWEGGLSFHSAFLGGVLVMGLFSALLSRAGESLSFGALADAVTPGLALGIAFGWAACLMGGCAYGAVGEGWGYLLLPDIYGIEAYRFATQAFGLGFALLLFVGVWLLRGRWPFEGAGFLMYALLYFAGHFFLEFRRGDEAIYLGPWRLAQVFDVVLILAAAGSLLLLWRRSRLAAGEPPGKALVEGEELAPELSAGEGSSTDQSAGDLPESSAE